MKKLIAFAAAAVLSCTALGSAFARGLIDIGKIIDELGEDKRTPEQIEADEAKKKELEENAMASWENLVKEIEPDQEYYIGRTVAASIIDHYSLLNSKELNSYLRKVCGAITMNSPQPYLYKGYSIAILNTDEINAMATPGGHIFISRALVEACGSEDALAAVIAHEVAHIQLKHSILSIYGNRVGEAVKATSKAAMENYIQDSSNLRKLESSAAALGMDVEKLQSEVEELYAYTDSITDTLFTSGFSKVQEYQADELALSLLISAGYDPNAMVDMLQLVEKYDSENPDEKGHGWGATHPAPKDRIKKVSKKLKKLKVPVQDRSARDERYHEYL